MTQPVWVFEYPYFTDLCKMWQVLYCTVMGKKRLRLVLTLFRAAIKSALSGSYKFKKTTRWKSIWPTAALNSHAKNTYCWAGQCCQQAKCLAALMWKNRQERLTVKYFFKIFSINIIINILLLCTTDSCHKWINCKMYRQCCKNVNNKVWLNNLLLNFLALHWVSACNWIADLYAAGYF